MALLAMVLTFMAFGGAVKAAGVAGAAVLSAPTLFDVMRALFDAMKPFGIAPKWLVSSSALNMVLLRKSWMSRSAGL